MSDKEKILSIIKQNPFGYLADIKKDVKLLDIINHHVTSNVPLKEKIYLFISDESNICKYDQKRKFKTITTGYGFCGSASKCQCYKEYRLEYLEKYRKTLTEKEKKIINEKKKATLQKNYGVLSPLQSLLIKNKTKQTMLERFGVDNAFQSPEVKEKAKNTLLEKYGVDNISKNENIKKKKKETTFKNYGVDTAFQSPEVKEKAKNTLLEKYGVDNISKCEVIKETVKKKKLITINKKYGVDNVFQIPEVIEKSKKTCQIKYGVQNYSQHHLSKESISILQDKDLLEKHYNSYSTTELINILGISISHLHQKLIQYQIKEKYKSSGEDQLYKFIQELGISNIQTNTRSVIPPLEIDIYLPDYNLGIEYCGLFWHSEIAGKKNKNYHIKKMKLCNELGIRLIIIFEDEWLWHTNCCKNRLLHFLGLANTICYARQTTIKEIDNTIYRNFLNQYHIQGYTPSAIKLGAFFNDNLVSVMSFNKKRKITNSTPALNTYELIRYASSGNIPGIGTKLFNYFIKTYIPSEIISYCDRRWGTGNFYKILGFTLDSSTPPNYWYFKNHQKREYRYKYTKHSLIKKGYDPAKTEWQIMQELGYDRIWDCGSLKFKYT